MKILAHRHFCLDFMAFKQVYHTRTFSVIFFVENWAEKGRFCLLCYKETAINSNFGQQERTR